MNRFVNPSDARLRALLKTVRTIAVVGRSPKAHRPSHQVARNLQRFGCRIIPVYSGIDKVLGQRAILDFKAFRNPSMWSTCFALHSACKQLSRTVSPRAKALWLQDGGVDPRAARAGFCVAMDRCIYRVYLRLEV
jgi:predicted CoA-binding protein